MSPFMKFAFENIFSIFSDFENGLQSFESIILFQIKSMSYMNKLKIIKIKNILLYFICVPFIQSFKIALADISLTHS